MNVEITLKNYRCFPDTNPAKFVVRTGMTSFLGVNNSGKSALLKFFFEFRDLFVRLADVGQLAAGISSEITFNPAGIQDQRELFTRSNLRDLSIGFAFSYEELSKPLTLNITVPHGTNRAGIELTLQDGIQVNSQKGVGTDGSRLVVPDHEQVEMQEALQVFQTLSRMRFIGAFRNALNVGEKADYFDMKTGQAFMHEWRSRQTGRSTVENEAIHTLSEDIRRIFELDDLRINTADDGQTLQLLVNGESRKLEEVGSGLAQFILVLGSVAFEEPSFILIDEPEMNLHPALQLDFLTTLASYTSDGVLFTTHNVGLAEGAADWSYALQRLGEGESVLTEYQRVPRLPELLGELSYSGFKDLTFEKLLLIEGRTDIKTLHQFLQLYGKAHKVVLVPMGGGEMINSKSEFELAQIARITGDVSVLIDSERASKEDPLSKERQAFVGICEGLQMPCHVLELRALENYLSDSAIKSHKGEGFKALGAYEKLGNADLPWAKTENWRIANRMSKADLDGTDLGEFLANL
ncbi:MAG: ATP-binding protein [Chloroflexi bacterium]|nr:ATP-binding protein [Chloroflexota bacterium]